MYVNEVIGDNQTKCSSTAMEATSAKYLENKFEQVFYIYCPSNHGQASFKWYVLKCYGIGCSSVSAPAFKNCLFKQNMLMEVNCIQ